MHDIYAGDKKEKLLADYIAYKVEHSEYFFWEFALSWFTGNC